MADCYAMNVDLQGDVWCCYYTEFPVVRIRGGTTQAVWQPSVEGAHVIAVAPPHALFLGGYDRGQELTLVELREDGSTRINVTTGPATAKDRSGATFHHKIAPHGMAEQVAVDNACQWARRTTLDDGPALAARGRTA